MSRRSKKSGGSAGLILLLLVLVMLIIAIVGVCVDWISSKAYADSIVGGGETETTFSKLSDLFDAYKDADTEIAGKFRAMAAFAILAVILAAGTTVFSGITKVLGWKLFKFLLVVIAIVCVICGVVSIITSFVYCDALSGSAGLGDLFEAGTEVTPYIGAWLTGLGSALAGLLGIAVAVKS